MWKVDRLMLGRRRKKVQERNERKREGRGPPYDEKRGVKVM